MTYLKLRDAEIYYEVYGEGRPFLFVAPLASMGSAGKPTRSPNFPATTRSLSSIIAARAGRARR